MLKDTDATEEKSYKGFNTSITHIFREPTTARSDCCALSCCGILQYDYNRYILIGKRPPSFKMRLVRHVLVPLAFFLSAGYCAVNINDYVTNEVFSTVFLVMCILWIAMACFRSVYKRGGVRRELLKKTMNINRMRAGYTPAEPDDIAFDEDDDDEDDLTLEQTKYEMTCVHRSCGCYRSDILDSDEAVSPPHDFCAGLSWLFSHIFCGKLFGCYLQCCGVCAVAQEARQIEALVPVERRRMDYITFQFYLDYVNEFRKLREEQDGNMWKHFKCVSELSRMLLKTLIFFMVIMYLFSITVSPKGFQLGNLLVFVATFLQAFLILFFVHWLWNRFDLSIDAVIKYFACGFILTTSTAIISELLCSIMLGCLRYMIMHMVKVDIDNDDGYQQTLSKEDFSLFEYSPFTMYATSSKYQAAFNQQYPAIAIAFIFLNAYVVAAFVEETCKYFGFKMVEHPDFLSDSELEAAASASRYLVEDEDVNQSESESFEDIGGCAIGGYGCDTGGYGCSTAVPEVKTSSRFLKSPTTAALLDESEPYQYLEAPQARSFESIGSGITVAMVSVALGFACCENLMYIFLYNGKSLQLEVMVLLSRSIFPVHPLCAAIQSIGVCRQCLENDRSISLRNIIFPALLLHGTYDFTIMILGFLSSLGDNDQSAVLFYSIMALVFSLSIIILGVIYYVKESRAQTIRLNNITTSRNFVGVSQV